MSKKQKILTLIEGDILNSKLVYTLNGIGVDANDYLTDASQVIFTLIGIKKENRTEELYRKYHDLVRQVEYLDLRSKGEKTRLALKIYNQLHTAV
jgi:hypothetical protein